jgi:hypothetical protein
VELLRGNTRRAFCQISAVTRRRVAGDNFCVAIERAESNAEKQSQPDKTRLEDEDAMVKTAEFKRKYKADFESELKSVHPKDKLGPPLRKQSPNFDSQNTSHDFRSGRESLRLRWLAHLARCR